MTEEGISMVRVLLAMLIAASPLAPSAQESADSRESLRGVSNVLVVVDINSGGANVLSESTLRTQVELALRRSGIGIADRDSVSRSTAVLAASFTALRLKNQGGVNTGYAVSYSLEVRQPVSLVRKPNTVLIVATWSGSGILAGSDDTTASHVRKTLDDLLDQFCNDYLSVNAPRKATQPAATP
jgi:hypothetical protein